MGYVHLMGYVPIPPPRPKPRSAAEWLERHEREHRHIIHRHRGSMFASRRRRAHASCVALIEAREADLGLRHDPWQSMVGRQMLPEPPPDAREVIHPAYELVDGAGRLVMRIPASPPPQDALDIQRISSRPA